MKKTMTVLVILLVSGVSFYIYSGMRGKERVEGPSQEEKVLVVKKEPAHSRVSPVEAGAPVIGETDGDLEEFKVFREEALQAVEEELQDVPAKEEIVQAPDQKGMVPAEEPVEKPEEVREEIELVEEQAEVPVEAPGRVETGMLAEEAALPDERSETVIAGGTAAGFAVTGGAAAVESAAAIAPSITTVPDLPDAASLEPEKSEDSDIPEQEKEQPVEIVETAPPATVSSESKNRVAVLPLENLSEDSGALEHVFPLLIKHLGKSGLEVVNQERLNNFLCRERVRSTGYISKELAWKIKEEFNVSNILAGAVISFQNEGVPRFGIMARLIDASDGTIIWADYAAATGDDFLTVLELGRLKSMFSLIPKVMGRLFTSFSAGDMSGEKKTLHRIAVMPFRNNSDFNNAGTIAMYMFIVELLKSQEFKPIEYGDIRKSIVKLRVRNRGELSYSDISALSRSLDAQGIMVGVIDDYSTGEAAASPPRVGITVRLVDGRTNQILWYNNGQSSGEDSLIALDWGRIRSVHSVAYRVVSKLVKNMERTKWQ